MKCSINFIVLMESCLQVNIAYKVSLMYTVWNIKKS